MFKDAADMSNCLMSGAHLIYDYNEFSNLLRQPVNVQRKVTRKFTPMDFARECQFTQTQTIIRQNTKKIGLLSAAKYFWTGGGILRNLFVYFALIHCSSEHAHIHSK